MPIKVSCSCGGNFAAPDNLAGKTVQCPKCKQPLKVGAGAAAPGQAAAPRQPVPAQASPAPAGTAQTRPAVAAQPAAAQRAAMPSGPATGLTGDLFDEIGIKEHHGMRCPKCNVPLKQGAVLCVQCGYHVNEGRVLDAAIPLGVDGHTRAVEAQLERAAIAIEDDKLEEKRNRAQGAPWWVLFIVLAVIVGFAVTMFMLPDKAFLYTSITVCILTGIATFVVNVMILVAAFKESTQCGLLYMFLPFYSLYYVFTRWDQVGSLFLVSFATSNICSLSYAGAMYAANAKPSTEGDAFYQRRPVIEKVIAANELPPSILPIRLA